MRPFRHSQCVCTCQWRLHLDKDTSELMLEFMRRRRSGEPREEADQRKMSWPGTSVEARPVAIIAPHDLGLPDQRRVAVTKTQADGPGIGALDLKA